MANSPVPSDFPWSSHWQPGLPWPSLSFMGYHRSGGHVGTRNYWLVIPLGAVDREQLALCEEAFQTVLNYQGSNSYERELRSLRDQYRAGSYFDTPAPANTTRKPLFANIDGIKFLPVFDGSPGIASEKEPLFDGLVGYCTHANVGGITVLGGGGSDKTINNLCERIEQRSPSFNKPVVVVKRATYKSDTDWLTAATRDNFGAMALLNKQNRLSAPLSHLVIGSQQGKTRESSAKQAVDEWVQLVTRVGATVLMANSDQFSLGHGVQSIHLSGDKPDEMTALTAAGCTLHLTPPDLRLPLENALAPIINLASDNDLPALTKPGEPKLQYLIKLASGELRTPSENGGQSNVGVYSSQ